MKCLDGTLCSTIDDDIYLLKEIPKQKLFSHRIDVDHPEIKEKKKPYILPMSHPWKKASFDRYVASKKYK